MLNISLVNITFQIQTAHMNPCSSPHDLLYCQILSYFHICIFSNSLAPSDIIQMTYKVHIHTDKLLATSRQGSL